MSEGGVKMTKGKYTKGFTLVELLVVIAIIAILAGALFLVINPAQLLAKSRDSRRMSDLTELNKALSMGVADQKIAITTIGPLVSTTVGLYGVSGTTTAATGGGWVQFTAIGAGLSTYLGVLPRDPGTNAYYYQGDSASSSWELNAVLEAADNQIRMTQDNGNNNGRWEIGTRRGLSFM